MRWNDSARRRQCCIISPEISTTMSCYDIFQTAQGQILTHFSLMCLKAVSQNGGAGIILTIAIIETHGPGESRHYCWSMTFKVHARADRSHETCFVRHEQFLSFPAHWSECTALHYSTQTQKYMLYSCHQPHMYTFYRLRLFTVLFFIAHSLPAARIIDDTSRRFLL